MFLLSTHGAAKVPAAFLALDQGGKEVFAALPLFIHPKAPSQLGHDLLRFCKCPFVDHSQVGPTCDQPVPLISVRPRPGEETGHLLFAIDNFVNLERVGKDAAGGGLASITAALGLKAAFVEQAGNLSSPWPSNTYY